MRFLITGTPRSGTTFGAVLFTELGLTCSHEWAHRPTRTMSDLVRWFRRSDQGESSWVSWIAARMVPQDQVPKVLHFVRDPWRTLDSLCHRNRILNMPNRCGVNLADIMRETLECYCPGIFEMPSKLERCAYFMCRWNQCIGQSLPDRIVCCVESIDARMLREMIAYVGADPSTLTDEDMDAAIQRARLSKTADVRNIVEMTPREIAQALPDKLLDGVNALARQHGYQTVETFDEVSAVA